jgi:hypothetical protein
MLRLVSIQERYHHLVWSHVHGKDQPRQQLQRWGLVMTLSLPPHLGHYHPSVTGHQLQLPSHHACLLILKRSVESCVATSCILSRRQGLTSLPLQVGWDSFV